ncbi:MAG: restriction endonuclease subunit S [Hyphomicrobiales bacterium]
MSKAFLSLPIADGIPKKRARFLFRVRGEKSRQKDEQLAATQSHGVLSQKRFMALTGNKIVAALAGTDNFNHVEQNDFVISLRSFEGGLEQVSESGCISPAYTVLAPLKKIEPKYFHFLLKSHVFISHLQTTVTGIRDGKSVKFENLANIVLPIPDLATQRAIADFLDRETARINSLIVKKQRLVELLREKRSAVITSAVTGRHPRFSGDSGSRDCRPAEGGGVSTDISRCAKPAWASILPSEWQVLPIKKIVSTPITDGPHETPEFLDEGVVFISAEAIQDGKIDFSRRRGHISKADNTRYSRKYAPREGDIYVVKSGATTGKAAMVGDRTDFNIWSPLAVIRADQKMDNRFVLYTIRSQIIQDSIAINWSWGTQQNIGMGTLGRIQVPLPDLTTQRAIADFLDLESARISKVTERTRLSIDRLKEYRAALITSAVTGQIDVSTYARSGSTDRQLDAIHAEAQA